MKIYHYQLLVRLTGSNALFAKKTDEKLINPIVKQRGAGFTTSVENLIRFEEIECLSFTFFHLREA